MTLASVSSCSDSGDGTRATSERAGSDVPAATETERAQPPGATGEDPTTSTANPGTAGDGQSTTIVVDDFESGALAGWQAVSSGSGGWFVYTDGQQAPNPACTDPNSPFDVPDPPKGEFAAVTDMNGPGTRILYRDLRLDGRFTLDVTVFHTSTAPLASPETLAYETPGPNQQFRLDLVDPSAPIDSVATGDVLVNVFHTAPGDPARLEPTDVSVDVSAWTGETVRLRLASTDNRGPLRAGADSVRFEPIGAGPDDRIELLVTPEPVWSTSSTPAPASTSASTPTADASGLDERVVDFVGGESGGASVLVIRDGVTTAATAGAANAAGDPVTPSTKFRVASITKSFVATMVLQLVDEGRIELDDPLIRYMPDARIGADVTIRALLSHRSGVPNYTDLPRWRADVYADRSRSFTPGDILAYVEAERPGEPEQCYAYSNTNYILLGQLVERLDATDLNTALDNRLTGPLGLSETRFATPGKPVVEGLAGGWSPGVVNGDPAAAYDSIASSAWAAGALISTTEDLATFLAALFAGDLISAEALTEMTTTGVEGYGLGLHSGPSDGPFHSGFGHTGAIDGYTSIMLIDPATGDTVVVLTNNDALNAQDLALTIISGW